ncbi:hypothetical protein [Neptunitalea chrysea]|nr:hypothetical protein [Neptunitalea chrysea]
MFTNNPEPSHFWIILLFMVKGVIGLSLYFGFVKGKNVSSLSWNSNYYNA